jgi:hypothetical protein
MKDFTYSKYLDLLLALKQGGYQFQTFSQFLEHPAERSVMLRHDVDDRRFHSLKFARLQKEHGAIGTYYFRMVPQSFDPDVMREVQSMGHEVGYHYEDMDFAQGNVDAAYVLFQKHLKQMREVVDVKTICMHGSPKSQYDNKDVWKKYRYQDNGIVGEPYFDLNYNEVFYITDTGRRWDGFKVSVRDKVQSNKGYPVYHSTDEIIEAIRLGVFPQQVMMNFHPQRWMDPGINWWKEKWIQSIKNQVKYWLIRWRQ